MGDVEYDLSLRAQLPDDAEEHADLVVGQAGGGLVERDDLCVADVGLHDFDHLLVGGGEGAHTGRRVDADAEFLDDLPGLREHPVIIDQAVLSARPAPQKDVFRDRHIEDDLALLIDDADARLDRVLRAGEMLLPSVEQHLPGGHGVVPVENFQERGFSGAVLSDERVDLPAFRTE